MPNLFEDAAERFERRMRDILLDYCDDTEMRHVKMDELMCETLEEFGCYEGVKIFKETCKYYI